MKRMIIRISEEELKGIMHNCVTRALQQKSIVNEHIDHYREIRLAQKTLCKFPLSDVGLRLESTPFFSQFKKVRDAIVDLNDALTSYIRQEK